MRLFWVMLWRFLLGGSVRCFLGATIAIVSIKNKLSPFAHCRKLPIYASRSAASNSINTGLPRSY
jgi:putative exporter of polyketide antibiotics